VSTRHTSHLVLGGARSGKSRYAVALASTRRRVAVVATARALDGDMAARIARHRAERPPGWTVVEEPLAVVGACRRLTGSADLAIVDCLTLWVSNRLLGGDGDEAILAGADQLAAFCAERRLSLVIVSNEVGEGVHPATGDGLRFRDLLGLVNQRVARAADRVTLMVAGIPVAVKGTPRLRLSPSPVGPHAVGSSIEHHERAPEAP
jgi:adenosylcobinamide kinase / adenosylcobinamide-phosphate guanylyltransferase